MNLRDQQLYDALRRDGPESASALARRLDVSTPTVTRALAKLGDAVVTIGKGRSSRYALYRDVRDVGHAWPLYRIDDDGQPKFLGRIEALYGRYRWRLVPEHPLRLFMRGEFEEGLYEDLPWFLQALRPQGYLGRWIVRTSARRNGVPEDLSLWQAEDIIASLLNVGIDLPGNLALGERIPFKIDHLELINNAIGALNNDKRALSFIKSAEYADNETSPRSSAAGERPKFSTTLTHTDNTLESVLVKFAPLVLDNPTTQRWADLLICEEIASRTLRAHSIDTARTEILDEGEWRFLQSTRFDRTPQGGRIGVFALDALDMAYVGSHQRDWLAGVEPLHAQGLIDPEDLDRIRLLNAFGRCIGNNDMHHGNLSFYAEPESAALRLAPVYDMLPMHYRPAISGLVRDTPFELPTPAPDQRTTWSQAAALAEQFWTTAAADTRLSKAFAIICARNRMRVSDWKIANHL